MPLLRDETIELVRIDLPAAGEWVEVRPRLSVSQRTSLTSAAMRFRTQIRGDGRMDDIPLDAVYEAMATAALEVGIVRWSFPEPVNTVNVRALDEESAALITSRLDELWQTRKEEDRKNSRTNGAASSAEDHSAVATRSSGTQ